MARFAALALLLASLAVPSAWAVKTGELAPETRGPALVGEGEWDLAALKGRWVLVDFWASWCAPCQLSLPAYQRLYDELKAEGQGERFEILAINIDAQRRDAERVLKRIPLTYPLMADPQGRHPERWALPAMPTAYLVDPEGRVHHIHAGFRAGDEAETRARVRAALGLP